MTVVEALFSTAKGDQLDIVAALRALSDSGNAFLVTVQDATQNARVWVDSQSTADQVGLAAVRTNAAPALKGLTTERGEESTPLNALKVWIADIRGES
jgi:hypothetical protein